MNEEQGPAGGQDEQAPQGFQAPDQPTAPVNLDSTQPIGGYPPPTGSPFMHQSPPPVEGPPAMASPLTAGQPTAAQPTAAESSPRSGPQSLGVGVISAIVAGALAIALVAAFFGGLTGAYLMSRGDRAAGVSASLPAAPTGSAPRPKGSIADIAARSLPSVVTIKVKGADAEGTGSGFVLRQDGYILTNNHVVSVAAASGKITVVFSDGKSAEATIIGRDTSYDLAVIRVERTNLPVLALG
ncbi:MAG: putative serine protease PepD, partial [Actinomycetota bacterium]|nr:putative serine protease PepD [Actinomycetota bacterium]